MQGGTPTGRPNTKAPGGKFPPGVLRSAAIRVTLKKSQGITSCIPARTLSGSASLSLLASKIFMYWFACP